MSHTPESKWRWRPPEGPPRISWPTWDEPTPTYFVTRREIEELGVPYNSIVMFPSENFLASLPPDLPPHERPMRMEEFDELMEQIRAEWVTCGYGEGGPPLPRTLSDRQLQFVANICAGFPTIDAYARAGYRPKASNAARLLRDEMVLTAILQHLALAG